MKQLILISALLFSFNGWSANTNDYELYLSCDGVTQANQGWILDKDEGKWILDRPYKKFVSIKGSSREEYTEQGGSDYFTNLGPPFPPEGKYHRPICDTNEELEKAKNNGKGIEWCWGKDDNNGGYYDGRKELFIKGDWLVMRKYTKKEGESFVNPIINTKTGSYYEDLFVEKNNNELVEYYSDPKNENYIKENERWRCEKINKDFYNNKTSKIDSIQEKIKNANKYYYTSIGQEKPKTISTEQQIQEILLSTYLNYNPVKGAEILGQELTEIICEAPLQVTTVFDPNDPIPAGEIIALFAYTESQLSMNLPTLVDQWVLISNIKDGEWKDIWNEKLNFTGFELFPINIKSTFNESLLLIEVDTNYNPEDEEWIEGTLKTIEENVRITINRHTGTFRFINKKEAIVNPKSALAQVLANAPPGALQNTITLTTTGNGNCSLKKEKMF